MRNKTVNVAEMGFHTCVPYSRPQQTNKNKQSSHVQILPFWLCLFSDMDWIFSGSPQIKRHVQRPGFAVGIIIHTINVTIFTCWADQLVWDTHCEQQRTELFSWVEFLAVLQPHPEVISPAFGAFQSKLYRRTGLCTGRFTQTNAAGGMPMTTKFRKREIANTCSRGPRRAQRNVVFLHRPNCQKRVPDVAFRGWALICRKRIYRIAKG